MKILRGGSGLGDSIYLRPFVDHYIGQDELVEVCSNYPDLFIGTAATVSPFRRERVNKVCHYVSGKTRKDTNQWQDLCVSAGTGEINMTINWNVQNQALIDEIQHHAAGRTIALVHGGRVPMGRTDGFAMDLLPGRKVFERVIQELSGAYLIRIGKGEQLYPLDCDLDLNDCTSVADLMDVASVCHAVIAQCSFAVPLAEIFGKPLLAVWAAKGMRSSNAYIQTITPKKVLSKASSSFVVDDWDTERIRDEVAKFYQVTFQ